MLDFKFSVCMSVYKNDKPEYVDIAIQSIFIKQTLKPNEIVLVVDGPVSEELESLIDNYAIKYSEFDPAYFTNLRLARWIPDSLSRPRRKWKRIHSALPASFPASTQIKVDSKPVPSCLLLLDL